MKSLIKINELIIFGKNWIKSKRLETPINKKNGPKSSFIRFYKLFQIILCSLPPVIKSLNLIY